MTRSRLSAVAERAGTRRPITWVALVGALLLPVVLGGILVAALYNPVERLDSMSAAIVNDDEPVTLDGQTVPLGRQLTAGLVEGSDDVPSNLDWTITNDDDAASGLADGTYAAVVTIPSNFSSAATSTAPGGTPERATIEVSTPPDGLVVDDAISAQITTAAASLLGTSLSEVYLENVFLGLTTLGDQLGAAADGATQLADGATQVADGATQLSDGAGQLATGADALSSGATQLAGGARQFPSGAEQAAVGLGSWAGGAQEIAANGRELAGGLQQVAAGFAAVPAIEVPDDVVAAANAISAHSTEINAGLTDAAATLRALADACDAAATPALCEDLTAAAEAAEKNLAQATTLVTDAGTIATGLQQLGQQLPQAASTLSTLSGGLTRLSGGIDQLAGGAAAAAGGVRQLSDAAGTLSSGASSLATGAAQLSTGADAAATGSAGVADGAMQLADGTGDLAAGLTSAVDQVPSYTDAQAKDLASVVADPVSAQGVGTNLFGASAVPLLAAVALWFGGLATFVVLRAVTNRTIASRRPSAVLALRALAPAAAIGALQGLLLAVVVQLAGSYDAGDWWIFAGVSVAAGIAFAAVNQALVAVFGGAGRWIAAVVGVLAIATGIVSTVPSVLSAIASILPTAPGYTGMLSALTTAGGLGAALVGLTVWTVLAVVATTLATAARRRVSTRQLLAASPA